MNLKELKTDREKHNPAWSMKFREKNKKSNDDPFPLQSEKGWKKVVKIYHHYTNLLMPNDPDFSNYKKTHI